MSHALEPTVPTQLCNMKMRAAYRRVGKVLSICVFLVGCPRKTAVWVEPGSTADHLVFRVSEWRGGSDPIWISVFRVDRFLPASGEYEMHWGFGAAPEGAPDLAQIVFGERPAGTEPLQGLGPDAPELAEGCYLAWTTGTGSATFLVQQDRRVLEIAWSSCSDVYAEPLEDS